MTNALPQSQSHLQAWPPPERLSAPAIVTMRAGRHRKPARRSKPSGGTPAAIPPHPPLVSGGWYHSLVRREVLGPGRYPLQAPVDKSVGAALALSAMLGPGGLCYISMTAGLLALGATAIALILFGFVSLLVIWPLAIATAAISAQRRHRWYERQ
jgi:hypothetical protein